MNRKKLLRLKGLDISECYMAKQSVHPTKKVNWLAKISSSHLIKWNLEYNLHTQ